MDWYSVEEGQWFTIAGFNVQGEWGWTDLEKHDISFTDTGYELYDLDRVTYHYQDDEGNDFYRQVQGPFEDWGEVWDAIADSLDKHGVTA